MGVGELNQVFTLQNGITGTCIVEVTNYSLAGLTQYPPLSPPNPERVRLDLVPPQIWGLGRVFKPLDPPSQS